MVLRIIHVISATLLRPLYNFDFIYSLRRVIEKLESIGLMEDGHAVARRNKALPQVEGTTTSSEKLKRERLAADDVPVEVGLSP